MGMVQPSFYAVASGYKVGIFSTWNECKELISGYSRSCFKRFSSFNEAETFLVQHNVPKSLWSTPPVEKRIRIEEEKRPLVSKVAKKSMESSDLHDSLLNKHPLVSTGKQTLLTSWCSNKKTLSCPSLGDVHNPSSFGKSSLLIPIEEVFVDGACQNNGQANPRAGFGGFYDYDDPRNFSLPVPPNEPQTNNRAELHAIRYAIEQGIHRGNHRSSKECRIPQLLIVSDSKLCIDGFTRFISKWEENGYRLTTGGPVKNSELWKECRRCFLEYQKLYSEYWGFPLLSKGTLTELVRENTTSQKNIAILLRHVHGHTGVSGNEMADHLAVMGINEKTEDSKGRKLSG